MIKVENFIGDRLYKRLPQLMASAIYNHSSTSLHSKQHLLDSFRISEEQEATDCIAIESNSRDSSFPTKNDIPPPPPLPGSTFLRRRYREKSSERCCVLKETINVWDELFKTGFGADVYITTQDQLIVPAHFSVLSIASPVLRKCLQDSTPINGFRYLTIPGVPHGAICAFIRFLYSSCYEEDDMKKFALHLLALSHSFVVPPLKRACVQYLESSWLTSENVIDVLQLARKCDAPRLSVICIRMIVRQFKTVASTEGWKVMRRVDPALEQELLESVVEADSRKEEQARKIQERKVYLQLHEAIEALIHICRDGCSTIGPRDKTLKGTPAAACGFSACKGIEMLVRHFFGCKIRVPGGCVHCKRMWQLLELHSRVCEDPEACNVPLCRHFKEKMRQQTKKDEAKWRILVRKVMEAKRTIYPSSPHI